MNILLVSADNSKSIKVGGKHIHQELLEKAWNENGHYTEVVYPKVLKGFEFQKQRIKYKLLRTIKLESKSGVFIRIVENKINEMTKLVTQTLSLRTFDYISAQDVMAAVACKRALVKANKNIPIYLTLHGYFAREAINYGYFSKDQENQVFEYSINLEKQAVTNVSGVVTVDTRLKNYVLEYFNYNKKMEVIYNSIDDQRFHPVNEQLKSKLRNKWGIDEKKKMLLVARRLVKKNGVIFSVKSLQQLVNNGVKNTYLVIVGDGPEKQYIEKYVKSNNLAEYVRFIGAVEHAHIDEFYKMTDILLMPSIKSDDVEEATSLSMLEGMVCGKIVIASAIGGMKEVIKDYENGLLVQEQDPEELAKKISEMLMSNELRQDISTEAHRYAKEHHGYVKHGEKFVDFYQSESIS